MEGTNGGAMTDNIYSNPSGYTEIPWQLSVQWFKKLVLFEVALAEEALNSNVSDGPEMRRCSFCGQRIPSTGSGKCESCWRGFQAPKSSKPEETVKSLLSDEEEFLIDADSDQLRGVDEGEVVELHNFLVECLRSACIRQLSLTSKSTRVREGLEVTEEWDIHFKNLFNAQPRVLLWPAVKHSMLGNPLAGEVFEWKNVGVEPKKASIRGKVAGAAALGVLAGFLFG